jgi:putative hydrolase of HD superfamily
MKITKKLYMEMNKVFMRLCLHRRWTHVLTKDTYDELAKQALNCMIAYFLAIEAEHVGKKVKWENFPKIVLHRAFLKAYILQDISESVIWDICKQSGFDVAKVYDAARIIITEKTDEEFCNELFAVINSYEARIYKAATKIATYIEFRENKSEFNGNQYEKMFQDIVQELKEFEDVPGFKRLSNPGNPLFQIFETLSNLRNQNRWAAYARAVDCSVLGHSLDVAVLAYFMSLEEHPGDEKTATHRFFMGLFHDSPEAWTKDMPSPIKDLIPGFREAVGFYEEYSMQENVYCILFDYSRVKFKRVMLEDESNKDIHAFMKGADYLDACMECLRNLIAGSRDYNFYRATVEFRDTMKKGKAEITPIAMEFYEYLVEEVTKVKSTLIFY